MDKLDIDRKLKNSSSRHMHLYGHIVFTYFALQKVFFRSNFIGQTTVQGAYTRSSHEYNLLKEHLKPRNQGYDRGVPGGPSLPTVFTAQFRGGLGQALIFIIWVFLKNKSLFHNIFIIRSQKIENSKFGFIFITERARGLPTFFSRAYPACLKHTLSIDA